MAKTKKQAVAATTASARRSEVVKAREGSRVDGPTDSVEKGDGVDTGSGSERARRATRRGTTKNRVTQQGSGEVCGTVAVDELRVGNDVETAGNGQSEMATGGESENYFSATSGEVMGEATGMEETRGATGSISDGSGSRRL